MKINPTKKISAACKAKPDGFGLSSSFPKRGHVPLCSARSLKPWAPHPGWLSSQALCCGGTSRRGPGHSRWVSLGVQPPSRTLHPGCGHSPDFPKRLSAAVGSEHCCCFSSCGWQSCACAWGWICPYATTGALSKITQHQPLPPEMFLQMPMAGQEHIPPPRPAYARSQVALPASVCALG